MNLMWLKIFYQGVRCLLDVTLFVVGITLLWLSTVTAGRYQVLRQKVSTRMAFAKSADVGRWPRLGLLVTWPARRLLRRGNPSAHNQEFPRGNSRSERDQIFFPGPGRGSPAGIPAGAIPTPGPASMQRNILLSCITWLSVLLFIGVALGVYLVSC